MSKATIDNTLGGLDIVGTDNIGQSSPWNVNSCYDSCHPKICSYVVIAEFDIDTGSTVRLCIHYNLAVATMINDPRYCFTTILFP